MADEADSDDVLGTPVAAYFDPALPGPCGGQGRSRPAHPLPDRVCRWVDHRGGAAGLARRRDPRLRGRAPRGSCPSPRSRTTSCRRTSAPPTSSGSSPRSGRPRRRPRSPTPASRGCPRWRRSTSWPTCRPGAATTSSSSASATTRTARPSRRSASAPTSRATSRCSGPRVPARAPSCAPSPSRRASRVRGGPCHVYGLDFGNRGLAMLEPLPHVGSVIYASDHERVVRLLTHAARDHRRAGAALLRRQRRHHHRLPPAGRTRPTSRGSSSSSTG